MSYRFASSALALTILILWGLKFFVAFLEGRSSGERIRVLSARAASVAVNCNTNVSVSEFQLLSGGSFREFEIPINSFCSIESISPVLVAQYAYSGGSDGIGDLFMMIIPPIELLTNNYLVEVFSLFVFNYVTVYVSVGAVVPVIIIVYYRQAKLFWRCEADWKL